MESATLKTPLGTLEFRVEKGALIRVDFLDETPGELSPIPQLKSRVMSQSFEEFSAYFAGQLTQFSLPLSPQGTEFQKQVWAELQNIPYGQTTSYGEISRKILNPKAFRAVGSANGKNPLAIIIPCHRVITSDHQLGGYSSGLWRKKWLLNFEGGKTF